MHQLRRVGRHIVYSHDCGISKRANLLEVQHAIDRLLHSLNRSYADARLVHNQLVG